MELSCAQPFGMSAKDHMVISISASTQDCRSFHGVDWAWRDQVQYNPRLWTIVVINGKVSLPFKGALQYLQDTLKRGLALPIQLHLKVPIGWLEFWNDLQAAVQTHAEQIQSFKFIILTNTPVHLTLPNLQVLKGQPDGPQLSNNNFQIFAPILETAVCSFKGWDWTLASHWEPLPNWTWMMLNSSSSATL
ncbi:hypothetical protein BJ165DRAFT_1534759 [Panaeolus papilionaceus]|nr:hypothetical protein BJ165DRAFT_1534759 [Panaeolus papilionaceus]